METKMEFYLISVWNEFQLIFVIYKSQFIAICKTVFVDKNMYSKIILSYLIVKQLVHKNLNDFPFSSSQLPR